MPEDDRKQRVVAKYVQPPQRRTATTAPTTTVFIKDKLKRYVEYIQLEEQQYKNPWSFSKIPLLCWVEVALGSLNIGKYKPDHLHLSFKHLKVKCDATKNYTCLEYIFQRGHDRFTSKTVVVFMPLTTNAVEFMPVLKHLYYSHGFNIVVLHRINAHCRNDVQGDKHIPFGLVADARNALEHFVTHKMAQGAGAGLVAMGVSMGASFLMRTVAECPKLFSGIALIAPPTSMKTLAAENKTFAQQKKTQYLMRQMNARLFQDHARLPRVEAEFFKAVSLGYGFQQTTDFLDYMELRRYIPNMRVPTLCIVDYDDLLCEFDPDFMRACNGNPCMMPVVTHKGNHCLYTDVMKRFTFEASWPYQKAAEFLALV